MEFSGISHYGSSVVNGGSDLMIYNESGEIFANDNGLEQFSEPYATDNEFIESQTILADGGDRFGVSAISFDLEEELLWMGNQGGHVTSYFGTAAQKYTSFQVHASEEVRHILTGEAGILALTSSSLRGQIRRGLPLFTHCSENMVEMQCMLQTSPTSLLMGGHQDKIIQFDLAQGIETGLIDVGENGCAILRQHPRYVCAGDPSGRITLRDPNSLSVEHVLETHSGSLSDFDVHGNLLLSCGFTNRQGTLSVDRFLMVYDLRMMRLVNPIPVVLDPLLLRFMPSFTSRVAVVSSLGQLQLADTVSLSTPNLSLYQVNTAGSLCLSLDMSSSCQCLAIGDSGGYIHVFTPTNSENPMINTYSRETEFADQIDLPPSLSIKDETASLAAIPLPYSPHGGKLLSDWPAQCLNNVYRPTPPIDPDILRSMKMQGTIGYAPNPMTRRRNQVLYESNMDLKRRNGLVNGGSSSSGDGRQKGNGEDSGFIAIPKRYRKTEVKYTRMGMDDFDFDIYNNTSFCGLEASLPNSYCNAMLQILYFLEPIRCILLSHICQREFCLSCELGFLFHMLDKSHGFPCQAANFQRAFRTVPEAYALGLLLSDQNPESKSNLIRLIQSWNRFILHQMHYELLEVKKQQNEILKEKQQKKLQGAQPPFVYNEQEFPSISNPVISSNVQWRLQQSTSTEAGSSTDVMVVQQTAAQSQFWEMDPYIYGYQDESRYWWIPTGTTYYSHYQDTPLTNGATPLQPSSAHDAPFDVTRDKENEDDTTEISRLLGSKQVHTHRCLKCGRQVSKESVMLLCNLVYPEAKEGVQYTFGQILGQSLCPEQVTPAWCDSCDRFQPTKQSRGLKQLPHILSINCNLDNPKDKAFWQTQTDLIVKKMIDKNGGETNSLNQPQSSPTKACRYGSSCTRPNCRFRHPGQSQDKETAQNKSNANSQFYSTCSWLPLSICMERLSNGAVRAYSLNDPSEKPIETAEEVVQSSNYDLFAVLCHVNDDRKNLISLINVGSGYHSRLGGASLSSWYLFNDFCITQVNAQEAIWFSLDWKVPCVLFWISRDLPKELIPTVSNPLTAEVFSEDNSLARNNGARKMITFTPLTPDEIAAPGELVAMDAEFVTLNQEESELRSDGKVSTVKPSHKSVARITCIRGQGPKEGTPFIDDYISTQEQVVDYLTKFSGIKPGDLDANFSSKHLTTLKSTYQKLRFLVDNGVKFVGHGLKNDFRVINLVVPPEQVVDTVLLFHLPNHRLISLRFLAWHFLGMKIQSVTHDSIEDARAALQLYKKYKEIDSQGNLKETLIDLYRVGNQHQWKVPGVDD
ncbi:PAN2-PAN3 deadenylation complex catalytic subunit PAN2 isoform X1 [Frankliniella occidentalis]|uniref:PAN2-PAN3 deadenylation complex catalytic subunit PAN2 n=1 Tax=Frankliniella occidentalis TaxID=133901 RepID=A0A6J1TKV8_FRAOC|nr:PAN2-PAN3 deadenylation complex catalytic subunit PAN2 isoform X1 [Frankliniella occidentalis]